MHRLRMRCRVERDATGRQKHDSQQQTDDEVFRHRVPLALASRRFRTLLTNTRHRPNPSQICAAVVTLSMIAETEGRYGSSGGRIGG